MWAAPPRDSFLGDIAPATEARFARAHLRKWMRAKRVPVPLSQFPGRAWDHYEPLGVVVVIGPWNYPLLPTLAPLVSAVSAGNCAVIKPSEHTPRTAQLITRHPTRTRNEVQHPARRCRQSQASPRRATYSPAGPPALSGHDRRTSECRSCPV
ncbi:aldehyde dehydrogenase family protein [Streptomyces shaanxiensis]